MSEPQKKQIVSYEEQQAMGLIRPANQRYVPAAPAAHKVPNAVIDAYAPHLQQATQFIVHHEVNPESRANAMVKKTHQVTIFLALLTGALMYVFQLHPMGVGALVIFVLWLALVSFEWLAAFALLAVLDWKETPSALQWRQTDGMLHLMKREQDARLMTMYGLSADEIKRLGK